MPHGQGFYSVDSSFEVIEQLCARVCAVEHIALSHFGLHVLKQQEVVTCVEVFATEIKIVNWQNLSLIA